MVMDWLRSCYATTMRLHQGSDEETPIVWYWAPPGAKWYEGPTLFGSHNWTDPNGKYNPLGEVIGAKRSYRKGVAPGRYQGQHFCGKAEWFQFGFPPGPLPPSPICDQDGVPQCCQRLPGGIAWTGSGLPGKPGYGGEVEAGTLTGFLVAGGEVEAGTLTGFPVAGGEVEAGTLTGVGSSIAGGEVEAGTLTGFPVAGGEVEAGTLTGFPVAGGEVEAGTLTGFPVAGGEVEAGDLPLSTWSLLVGGEVEAGDSLTVVGESIGGEVEAGQVPQLVVEAGEVEAGAITLAGVDLVGGEVEAGDSLTVVGESIGGEVEAGQVPQLVVEAGEAEAGELIDSGHLTYCSPAVMPLALVLRIEGLGACAGISYSYVCEYHTFHDEWLAILPPSGDLTFAAFACIGDPGAASWSIGARWGAISDGVSRSGDSGEYPFRWDAPGLTVLTPLCSGTVHYWIYEVPEVGSEAEGGGISDTITAVEGGEVETGEQHVVEVEGGEVETGQVPQLEVEGGEVETGESGEVIGQTSGGEVEGGALIDYAPVTPCCPIVMPDHLVLTIVNVSGCSSIAGSYDLDRVGPGVGVWLWQHIVGGVILYGGTMICDEGVTPAKWYMQFTDTVHEQFLHAVSITIDPLDIEFPVFGPGYDPCPGTFTIRVTL